MGSPILRKAVDALQLVAARGEASARDIAEVLALTKSSAHRLTIALLDAGLIQSSATGNGFVLGPVVNDLVGGPAAAQRLRQVSGLYLARLRDSCGETVALHAIQGDRRLLVDQAESRYEHRWVYGNLGVPMPLHAGAASKMLLASLPARRAEEILQRRGLASFTAKTPQDSAALLRELARIRKQAYAISEAEVTPGIASIAVPVPAAAAACPAIAISLTGPSVRLSPIALKGFLPHLREAAAAIAQGLGDGEQTPDVAALRAQRGR